MPEIVYNILALIIVAFAFFLLGRKIYIKFFTQEKDSCSSGCASCSAECELRNVVQPDKD